MSSFRLKSSYPFRISFTTFSPPVETDFPATAGVPSDTKTWSQLPPPSLPFDLPDHKEVEVGLIRKVWTKTHGTPTEVVQRVGPALSCVADSGGGESSTTRAWYSAVELVDMDDYRARSGRGEGCRPGEKRWAVETVVVGEMVLGKGATMGIEPSFGPETARGLLACSVRPAPHPRLQPALTRHPVPSTTSRSRSRAKAPTATSPSSRSSRSSSRLPAPTSTSTLLSHRRSTRADRRPTAAARARRTVTTVAGRTAGVAVAGRAGAAALALAAGRASRPSFSQVSMHESFGRPRTRRQLRDCRSGGAVNSRLAKVDGEQGAVERAAAPAHAGSAGRVGGSSSRPASTRCAPLTFTRRRSQSTALTDWPHASRPS